MVVSSATGLVEFLPSIYSVNQFLVIYSVNQSGTPVLISSRSETGTTVRACRLQICTSGGKKLVDVAMTGTEEIRGVRRGALLEALASGLDEGTLSFGVPVVSVSQDTQGDFRAFSHILLFPLYYHVVPLAVLLLGDVFFIIIIGWIFYWLFLAAALASCLPTQRLDLR